MQRVPVCPVPGLTSGTWGLPAPPGILSIWNCLRRRSESVRWTRTTRDPNTRSRSSKGLRREKASTGFARGIPFSLRHRGARGRAAVLWIAPGGDVLNHILSFAARCRKFFVSGVDFDSFSCNLIVFIGLRQKGGRGGGYTPYGYWQFREDKAKVGVFLCNAAGLHGRSPACILTLCAKEGK